MKKYLFALISVMGLTFVSAQIDMEISKVGFYPHVIADENMSPNAKRILDSRVDSIILQNGLGDIDNRQFALLVKVNFVDRSVTATVPPMYKEVYSIQLIVVDNLLKIKHGVYNMDKCIGISSNKNKATTQAISRLRSDERVVKWLNDMKESILSYYRKNCMLIMIEVDALREQKKYDKAIEMLSKVPKITEYCFSLSQKKMIEIFKEKMSNKGVSEPETDVLNTEEENSDVIDRLDDTGNPESEDLGWVFDAKDM